MEYVNLGSTGTKVSRISLGCLGFGSKAWRDWVLEEPDAVAMIARALEAGINYFDTADFYSQGESERVLGSALKQLGITRERVVIATKVGLSVGDGANNSGLSRKHIRHAIENSLRRLGTDYVDLYQIHRFDHSTPMEETIDTLDGLVRSGKILYFGASTMRAFEFARLIDCCRRLGTQCFSSMQVHYNLLYREEEREMIPLCNAEKIAVLPWSPLARGVLARGRLDGYGSARASSDDTTKRFYADPSDRTVLQRVSEIAAQRAVAPAQIALAWLLQRPGVIAPIIGATKAQHIEDACRSVELTLTADEVARLEEPYTPHALVGHI